MAEKFRDKNQQSDKDVEVILLCHFQVEKFPKKIFFRCEIVSGKKENKNKMKK
jgi:hypothetical protein